MKALATALIAARQDMPDPRKSGDNPQFDSKFVPRDAALDAVVPALLKQGLMLVQSPIVTENGVGVHSQLIHSSGEMLDLGVFTVVPAKNSPQGAVAATTYASRCAIMLVFSIAGDEDDDGNSVSQPKPAKPKAEPKPARAAAKPLLDAIDAAIARGADEVAVKKEVVRQWGKPDDLTPAQIAEAVKFVQSLGGGSK